MNKWLVATLCAVSLSACNSSSPDNAKASGDHAAAHDSHNAAPMSSGVEHANFDPAVRPQDDLFRAVNGNWLVTTEIPADKSNYGSFTALDDAAQAQLRQIIEELASTGDKPAGSLQQKIGDYYASFMDEARADAQGLAPLADELARIAALKDKAELPALMAHLVRIGVGAPVLPYIHQDPKNSSQYVGDFWQYGLSLPNRDYYLIDDEKFSTIRRQYLAHMEKMFQLAGWDDPAGKAASILALETKLATAQWDKLDNRDPQKTYNTFAPDQLDSRFPGFGWSAYLQAVGYNGQPQVLISQPSYAEGFAKLVETTPLSDWQTYFSWQLLSEMAPLLSKPFVDENFAFFSQTLDGVPEQEPRWKRGVTAVETALGEAVGQIYVQRHFPPENKARMEAMVKNLITAYGSAIDELDWMSEQTKAEARTKLSKFNYKIGYPDQWRDYSTLAVVAGDVVGNSMRSAAFGYQREVNKLGKPIDRSEWGMTPQTVNAYYNPEMNEIVFPAAILQPPFFNMQADDAVNYGAIGAVIGHEISHGFDDQGAQYDGDGNLRNWWSADDLKKFQERGARLAAQYDRYEPVPGYHVDGKFTLGENIADLGGVTIALRAYQLSLHGAPAPVIDNMTAEQRFFVGWAQIWRRKYREENLLNRLKTDPHSPSEYRANGVVVNVPAFYQAYGLKQGDGLYRDEAERIRIW